MNYTIAAHPTKYKGVKLADQLEEAYRLLEWEQLRAQMEKWKSHVNKAKAGK